MNDEELRQKIMTIISMLNTENVLLAKIYASMLDPDTKLSLVTKPFFDDSTSTGSSFTTFTTQTTAKDFLRANIHGILVNIAIVDEGDKK